MSFSLAERARLAKKRDDTPVGAMERKMRLLAVDEIGVHRVLEAPSARHLEDLAVVSTWGESKRARRVVTLTAGVDATGGAAVDANAAGWFAMGRADDTVDVCDGVTGGVLGGGSVAVGALPVCATVFGPSSASASARLITVTENGDARVHAAACDVHAPADARIVGEWEEVVSNWKPCQSAIRACVSEDGATLATGGKGQGNNLKTHDIETQKVLFKAKAQPPNWLGYVAPPWVSAVRFLPGRGGGDGETILVGTGDHALRLYDLRQDSKRAVMDVQCGERENATTVMAVCGTRDGNTAFAADARGAVVAMDLRTQRSRGKLRGNSGSVRELALHPTLPLVATASLDRWIRVYDVDTCKCVGAGYTKQALCSVAWDVRGPAVAAAAAAAAERKKAKKKAAREGDDAGAEVAAGDGGGSDVAVKKKKKKKKRLCSDDDDVGVVKKKKKKKKRAKEATEDD
jgi:hypothetical protein